MARYLVIEQITKSGITEESIEKHDTYEEAEKSANYHYAKTTAAESKYTTLFICEASEEAFVEDGEFVDDCWNYFTILKKY